MSQDDTPEIVADLPFQVVEKEALRKLQQKKERIDDVMEIVKEYWLEDDQEFMDEIQEAMEVSLKN